MDDVACCVLIRVGVRCAGGSKSSIKGAEVLVAMRHGQSLFRYLDDAQPCSLKLPARACLRGTEKAREIKSRRDSRLRRNGYWLKVETCV